MTAIVTECYEDYNTLIHELNSGPPEQRIKASVLIVQDGRCNRINRPYDSDRMRSLRNEYGIVGYLDQVSVQVIPTLLTVISSILIVLAY